MAAGGHLIDGAVVATLRRERAMFQRELADSVGISVPALQRIEAGRVRVLASTLRNLATALNTTVDALRVSDESTRGMQGVA